VLKGGVAAGILGAIFIVVGFWAGFTLARPNGGSGPGLGVGSFLPLGGQPAASHPSFDGLQRTVTQTLAAAGGVGGVSLIGLDGSGPQSWAFNGDQEFTAASTYKLPLLMEEAQYVTAGRWRGTDTLCYQDSDLEDGYFNDYEDGTCMSRSQLEHRVGLNSDNTAAHILVRYDGGGSALNRYAQAHGTKSSQFYDPNTTTSSDLARLWVDEAGGRAGGRSAQQYLYPILTHTSYEDGIPAGMPSGTIVIHKIGVVDTVINDTALVPKGPRGAYVLAICTQGGPGGDAGWKVLADISRAVWQFEATR
jgi:beta-lactamase class A